MDKLLRPLNELRKITLYHGSKDGSINSFSLNVGRPDVDFGRGVYFTTKLQQAIDWSVKHADCGYVYVCEFDPEDLKILEYRKNCDDFAEIIHLCRIDLEELACDFIEGFEQADCVYGCLVDGGKPHLEELANQYNEGDIPFSTFYEELDAILYTSDKDQLCIKTIAGLQKITIREIIQTTKPSKKVLSRK
jgi:hypothetical protein